MEFKLPTEIAYDQTARAAEQVAQEMKTHQAKRMTKTLTGKIRHWMSQMAFVNHWAFVFAVVLIFVLICLVVFRPSFVMSRSPEGTATFSIGKAMVVSILFAGVAAAMCANL